MEWPESPSSMCPAALTMKMGPHQGHSPGAWHHPPRRGPLSDLLSSLGLLPGIIEDHDLGRRAERLPRAVRYLLVSSCHPSALSSSVISPQPSALRALILFIISAHTGPPPFPPASKCIFVQLSVSDYESMIMWYKRDRWLLVPSCLP